MSADQDQEGKQDGDRRSDDERIKLIVMGEDGNVIKFRVKMSTQLGILKKSYSERVGVPLKYFRFIFDGRRICDDETPKQLKMENNDGIDVYITQGLSPSEFSYLIGEGFLQIENVATKSTSDRLLNCSNNEFSVNSKSSKSQKSPTESMSNNLEKRKNLYDDISDSENSLSSISDDEIEEIPASVKSHKISKSDQSVSRTNTESAIEIRQIAEIRQKSEEIEKLKLEIENMKNNQERVTKIKIREAIQGKNVEIEVKDQEINKLNLQIANMKTIHFSLKNEHAMEMGDLKVKLKLKCENNRKLEKKLTKFGEETKRRNLRLIQLQAKNQLFNSVSNEFQSFLTETLSNLLPEEIEVDE